MMILSHQSVTLFLCVLDNIHLCTKVCSFFILHEQVDQSQHIHHLFGLLYMISNLTQGDFKDSQKPFGFCLFSETDETGIGVKKPLGKTRNVIIMMTYIFQLKTIHPSVIS